MLQGRAIEIFHGDERSAVLLANVVNRADVGVVQGGSRLRLALETGQSQRIAGHFVWEELECDKTVKASVFGFVHDTHAATAKFFEDVVVRNLPTTQIPGG